LQPQCPVENFNFKSVIDFADPAECNVQVKQWAETYNITKCVYVSRDIGVAPPRQSEYMIKVPGETYEEQLNCCLDGVKSFLPSNYLPTSVTNVLEKFKPVGLLFFVTVTSDGFCKMGILVPSTIKLRNAIIESAINDDYKLYTATTAKIEEFFFLIRLVEKLKHQFNISAFIGYQKVLGTMYIKKGLI